VIDMTKTRTSPTPKAARDTTGFAAHDHRILLLQGGGALGAYHGGVYEGIAEVGFSPDRVVGISIGAINAKAG
jgi:NTE family protein